MNKPYTTFLDEFGKLDDLAKDWLIKSWTLSGDDKLIAEAYYRKADKERSKVAKEMEEICRN